MDSIKRRLNKIGVSLLKNLRWVIVSIGLILFVLLWYMAKNNDPSSATGSLLINLAATALTVAFTALLIDWLQERRQKLLVAKPLEYARHELGSVCFMLGIILGKPYLPNFATILADSVRGKTLTMNGLADVRKNLIAALSQITPENCPATTQELAAALAPQLTERVNSIDEVLRLYGYSFDIELRDSVHLLRDRLISFRNSLSAFEMGGGVEGENAMHELVGLGIRDLMEAVRATDVEWAQVKKTK